MRTRSEQIAALLKMSGQHTADLPADLIGQQALIIRLVSDAMACGHTWAEIGDALFEVSDSRMAKRAVRRMAREAQRELIVRGNASAAAG
jgi:hypothetical protein